MKRGKFIVIEGSDGLGKTSLVNELKVLNLTKFFTGGVSFYNDPSNTLPIAKDIRKILKESCNKMQTKTDLLLYLAARNELNYHIEKMLNTGMSVICDRYSLTTYVYQGINVDRTSIMNVIDDLCLEIEPDLTIVLTRETPYRKQTNDSIEEVYKFEDTEREYEQMCKNKYIRERYNIMELPMGNKSMNEKLSIVLTRFEELNK